MLQARMKASMNRPRRLQNITSKAEIFETLSAKAKLTEAQCSRQVCNGALMLPKKSTGEPRPKEEVLMGAKEFIDEYYMSIKRFNSEQHKTRWEAISASVEETGTYELTKTELMYGTKLAWRNAPRCIGRIQWSKLQLFDARHVSTPAEMFEAICNQLKYASNGGNIRSAITVFPARTDGKHDFRVWNGTILSYAGYRQEDGSVIGDPHTCELTEIAQSIGWPGKGGRWDILPLVLSANGEDPEWFEIPEELIIRVPITHPEYKCFDDMGLQWYAVPGVSNMCFDCGGLEFPACPFNGWYMATEIGARDLCDPQRYNILEEIAQRMGLDTRNVSTLWKDKALVEVNIAVLHSYQKHNVTIMDHHTASDSFMKHFENEQKLRGGCPADWVWIVPPISGSICPVFHQEMSLYHLKPSYEYQDPAWKTHVWKNSLNSRTTIRKMRRKLRFKELAWAVLFTSGMFAKALSKRSKATILYATETGKSEIFAKKLEEKFNNSFNTQVYCMADYELINLKHEVLILVVTSTFGNGDPPENGKEFAKNLYAMKVSTTAADIGNVANKLKGQNNTAPQINGISKNFRSSMSGDNVGPLSSVRYAVFALGSSAYPKYCAFGKHIDNLLAELGGNSLMTVTCGDERDGQEQSFTQWASEVFKRGCDTFCVDDTAVHLDTQTLNVKASATAGSLKLQQATKSDDPAIGLSRVHSKKIRTCQVLASRNLHGDKASSWAGPQAQHNTATPSNNSSITPYRPEILSTAAPGLTSIQTLITEKDINFFMQATSMICVKLSEGVENPESFVTHFNQVLTQHGYPPIQVPPDVIASCKQIYINKKAIKPTTNNLPALQ